MIFSVVDLYKIYIFQPWNDELLSMTWFSDRDCVLIQTLSPFVRLTIINEADCEYPVRSLIALRRFITPLTTSSVMNLFLGLQRIDHKNT